MLCLHYKHICKRDVDMAGIDMSTIVSIATPSAGVTLNVHCPPQLIEADMSFECTESVQMTEDMDTFLIRS